MQPYMMNPNNYPMDMTAYQQQLLMQLLNNQRQNQQMNQWQQNNQNMNYNQQQNKNIEFIGAFVDNFEQVKSYPVPLGGTVLLMDSNNARIYTKQLNNQGEPIYNVFKFESLDGPINQTQQNQQAQVTQVENNSQQVPNNQSQPENLINELVNTVKQMKDEQKAFTEKVEKAFGAVSTRLLQLEGKGNTAQGGHD